MLGQPRGHSHGRRIVHVVQKSQGGERRKAERPDDFSIKRPGCRHGTGMLNLRALLWVGLIVVVPACGSGSSDGSSGTSGASSGSSGGTSGTSGGTSGSSGGANCGTATCDATKSYCALTASKDAKGDTTWTPSGCKPLPTGCTLPAPPQTCAPPDCSRDPSAPGCMSPPDFEKCSPSKFCSCVEKSAGCPTSGVVVTTCKQNNALVGFGCTS